MHKATYEQVYGKPYELDERDRALLAERTAARARLQGPLVGDFLITPEGKLRFTHDWGDTIQTTVRPGYDSSFYIDRTGYMSFSGSLAPGIARDTIEPTGETEEGTCWFFSHDYATAHNGVHVTVPCRVYRMKEARRPIKTMRTIRVHYSNGDHVVTSINGTEEEIRAYYIGHVFNLGDGAGGDLLARATSVEFLEGH